MFLLVTANTIEGSRTNRLTGSFEQAVSRRRYCCSPGLFRKHYSLCLAVSKDHQHVQLCVNDKRRFVFFRSFGAAAKFSVSVAVTAIRYEIKLLTYHKL
ncbi:unnamed protein product, partial [Heterotrigona itama]